MEAKHIKAKRSGFVLAVVLCMSICLCALLLGFNYKSRTSLRMAERFRESHQALNCARAGLNIAIAAISDANNIHTNKTLSNLFSGHHSFAVGDGRCLINVTEETGKLNVNLLTDKNGTPNRTRIEQLLRLIDLLNREDGDRADIGYGLVPAIIDWTDSDDQVTCLPFIKYQNMGAESGYYGTLPTPCTCKNRSLETTEELLLVKGITPEIFDRVKDYVTVYGDGKININFAPKLILQSLSEKMDAALAQLIIDRRQFKPFDGISELKDVPGMTDSTYQTIGQSATVDSTDRYYHVTSRAIIDELSRTIIAVLGRNMRTKNVEVILYKEL